MSLLFVLRLAFDFLALGLLLAALAYDWLGNLVHEVIGTALFGLLLLHNAFNRRWYGTIAKSRPEPRSWVNRGSVVALLIAMLILLATSLLISRSVFTYLPLSGGVAARQIHGVAAYWGLVLVSFHLGMRWALIMATAQGLIGLRVSPTCAFVLRLFAVAIAAYGIHSSIVLGVGARLMAEVTMNFWNFDASTIGFFAHLVSIACLYATLSHYTSQLLRTVDGPKSRTDSK